MSSTCSLHAFIEPFVVGQWNVPFSLQIPNMCITKPPNPWNWPTKPRLRTTMLEYIYYILLFYLFHCQQLLRAVGEDSYNYNKSYGIIALVLRILITIWYLYELKATMVTDQNPHTLHFLLQVSFPIDWLCLYCAAFLSSWLLPSKWWLISTYLKIIIFVRGFLRPVLYDFHNVRRQNIYNIFVYY